MPTVLKIKGFRFFFFSNEGNEPPHIHVESAGKYAKFWLEPIEFSQSVGYNKREINELQKIIIQNQQFFLEKWHDYFSS